MLPPLPRTLMAGLATLLLAAATAPGLEPAARIEQLKAKAATCQIGAPALVAALTDPQPPVRVAALELLATVKGRAAAVVAAARIGTPAAVPIVSSGAKDAAPVVRLETVRALGLLGQPEALIRLRELAAEGDLAARRALQAIGA